MADEQEMVEAAEKAEKQAQNHGSGAGDAVELGFNAADLGLSILSGMSDAACAVGKGACAVAEGAAEILGALG